MPRAAELLLPARWSLFGLLCGSGLGCQQIGGPIHWKGVRTRGAPAGTWWDPLLTGWWLMVARLPCTVKFQSYTWACAYVTLYCDILFSNTPGFGSTHYRLQMLTQQQTHNNNNNNNNNRYWCCNIINFGTQCNWPWVRLNLSDGQEGLPRYFGGMNPSPDGHLLCKPTWLFRCLLWTTCEPNLGYLGMIGWQEHVHIFEIVEKITSKHQLFAFHVVPCGPFVPVSWVFLSLDPGLMGCFLHKTPNRCHVGPQIAKFLYKHQQI